MGDVAANCEEITGLLPSLDEEKWLPDANDGVDEYARVVSIVFKRDVCLSKED